MKKPLDLDCSNAAKEDAPEDAPHPTTTQETMHTYIHQSLKKKLCLEVHPFGENQWVRVLKAAAIRSKKRNFEHSKYHTLILHLPKDLEEVHGYHINCYKSFTVVSSIQLQVNVDAAETASRTLQCNFL